jgi:[CysO sulfur-carrier protein]-S-L-cysteine hydrolase
MTGEQWDALIAHASEDAPNECCGYLSMRDGRVEEVFRAANKRASPYGFELGFKDLMAANDLEDQGLGVGIYHSHPRSPAEPSQMDINVAQYPDWVYVIVTLLDGVEAGGPRVRAWRIVDRKAEEEPVDVG